MASGPLDPLNHFDRLITVRSDATTHFGDTHRAAEGALRANRPRIGHRSWTAIVILGAAPGIR